MPTAAHIITADAIGLGAPAILVFKHDPEDSTDVRIVWHRDLSPQANRDDALDVLDRTVWRTFGSPVTTVETGYFLVNVERIGTV